MKRRTGIALAIVAAAIATTAQAGTPTLGVHRPNWIGTPSCAMSSTKLISCTARVSGLDPRPQATAFLVGSAEWVCPSNAGIGGYAQSGLDQIVPIENGRWFTVSWQVPSEPAHYSWPSADNTCTAGWRLELIDASLQIYQPNYLLGYGICDPAYGAACLLYWNP
jgi:hypothetical protein